MIHCIGINKLFGDLRLVEKAMSNANNMQTTNMEATDMDLTTNGSSLLSSRRRGLFFNARNTEASGCKAKGANVINANILSSMTDMIEKGKNEADKMSMPRVTSRSKHILIPRRQLGLAISNHIN
jgi:hypothetical protein